MRIASITKPITLAALRIAARDFDIGWDDRVWCTEAGQIGCWLQIEPASGGFADGLGDITIRQLVYHEGGFDRNASFDPMFRSLQIASELGLDRPPEAVEVAAYMASQPLDFAPGTRAEYSNFGYLLLGLAIEEATGTDLVEYLRETVFTVAGDDDVQLGATLPEDRDPREPYYYCPGWSLSVFDGTTEVCWPDGGWYLEAMEAHGGLVMPAHTLIAFLDHFCLDGKAHEPWEACGDWGFYGSLDGTLTLAGQRSSGVNYAVFFNRRDGVAPDDLIAMMDGQADALAEGR
jgi:N-acyl-D-amino-acid deacylase